MSDAPERIWFLWDAELPNGRVFASKVDHSEEGYPEYRRADLPATLAQAMMVPEVRELVEALENAMGHLDTPIGRRKLGIDANVKWLTDARAALHRIKEQTK